MTSGQQLVLDSLKACDMFSEASEATLNEVACSAVLREYQAGSTLFWENDPNGTLYLVCRGQIAIERFVDDGKTVSITARNPGDVIGEVSLFEDVPRTADARVTLESEVAIIDGQQVLALIRKDSGLAMGVIHLLARKLHESIDRTLVQSWKIQRRLAVLLVDLTRKGYTKVEGKGLVLTNSLTQEEMATLLNCTREHVNRALRQLKSEGVMDFQGRTLIVRDPKTLKAMANGFD